MQHRWIFILLIYIFLLGGGWLAGQWLPQAVDLNISPRSEPLLHTAIMGTMILYIMTSALPFVPGAEIGLGLILLFGGKIALLVYAGMILALTLAFVVGRYLPLPMVATTFERLGFARAQTFMLSLGSLSAEERLALLIENSPRKYVPFLLRHRYLALILVLNLPGNSLIGGGGGIAFIVGLSGLFSYLKFLAAIVIAVAPLPVVFYFTM